MRTLQAMPQPSRFDFAIHHAKVQVHRLRRQLHNWRKPLQPAKVGRQHAEAPRIGEDHSPLWNRDVDPREWALEIGKVENLRIAARALHGLEFAPGQVFSFWAQVGPPWALRGFVQGRELREGCVVPGVGGGLCLLSNGLFAAARQANMEILERHAHSQRPPGSRAALGEDATVAWNYVDFRCRAEHPWRLEVELASETLIVTIRGDRRKTSALKQHNQTRWVGEDRRSCLSCDQSCPRAYSPPRRPSQLDDRRVWLLDAAWPEFIEWMQGEIQPDDRVLQPIDGLRFGLKRYAWPQPRHRHLTQFPIHTIARAIRARRYAQQGAARQRIHIHENQRLAEAMAKHLRPHDTALVVSQNLLPHLYRCGALAGRQVTVLMQSLPMATVQTTLDQALKRHPCSPTLGDFRADPSLIHDESQALALSNRWVTPHECIAALGGEKALHLAWTQPRTVSVSERLIERGTSQPRLWLPASTVGRKGVWELREALARLGPCTLWISGQELEGEGFWDPISTLTIRHGTPPWAELDIAVLPAWIESQPRQLLRALSFGVPVVATRMCGLSSFDGLTVVEAGDVDGLWRAIRDTLSRSSKLQYFEPNEASQERHAAQAGTQVLHSEDDLKKVSP